MQRTWLGVGVVVGCLTAAACYGQMMGGQGMGQGTGMMGGQTQPREGARGKAVYQGSCAGCHTNGIAGAPRVGDKEIWGSMVKKEGKDVLVRHAIDGYQGNRGYMPPKGGNSSLSDAQVKAAVEYMIQRSR